MPKKDCCNCGGMETVSVSVPCPECKSGFQLRLHDNANKLYRHATLIAKLFEPGGMDRETDQKVADAALALYRICMEIKEG